MKKYTSFLIAAFLISTALSMQNMYGQDKTKDKEKDAKIQKSIDEQKKAMADQKKAHAEAQQNFEEQQEDLEKSLNEANEELENANAERAKVFMRLPRGNRSFNFNEPFVLGGDMNEWHFGDEEHTSWDFSKAIKDNSFSKEYSFDVDKTSKSVVMSVMGDCKSGEIRIKIIMPNGKNYSDILIDESGNLNWRKSFNITDTENQDKTGDWKFQISSAKATGFFKISLQAY